MWWTPNIWETCGSAIHHSRWECNLIQVQTPCTFYLINVRTRSVESSQSITKTRAKGSMNIRMVSTKIGMLTIKWEISIAKSIILLPLIRLKILTSKDLKTTTVPLIKRPKLPRFLNVISFMINQSSTSHLKLLMALERLREILPEIKYASAITRSVTSASIK